MKKVGVLGGTFDPIHNGHLFIAENAFHIFSLDKVFLIPTATSPHKLGQEVTDKRHRFEMARLGAGGNENFYVCDIEFAKDEISYTVNTMEALINKYPDTRFYYIVGSDSLRQMTTWKDFSRLAKMVEIIFASRYVDEKSGIQQIEKSISDSYGVKIHNMNIPVLEISSTDIRRRIKEGLPVKYLLPRDVEQYIKKYNLYK